MDTFINTPAISKSHFPWRAYVDLCKPRVVILMLLTVLVGMLLATSNSAPLHILIFGTLGIGLVASAGAAINHLVDRHLDAIMLRTSYRPLPTGRVSIKNATIFAGALAFSGTIILIVFTNILTAILTFISMIGYAGIYTLYLKRTTPQNIVIGGAAGAAPPLLGWTAITGHIDPPALLLMLIIFVWTPPHFWALAIERQKEYAKANIPMLPVIYGVPFTKLNILLYTILLTAVTILPYAISMCGLLYLIGAMILDAFFLYFAIKLFYSEGTRVAKQTFRFSIYYLMFLFIALLVDHYI
ncbi:MAG: heme o synthase [Gammaproteobacteria bacterium]